MGYLALSRLAAYDLESIAIYSVERWGQSVADDYMSSLERAFQRLKDHPELLKNREDVSDHLRFYLAGKHFIVCTIVGRNVYVLTVIHGAMDLPERVAELDPLLQQETDILHHHFLSSQKRDDGPDR